MCHVYRDRDVRLSLQENRAVGGEEPGLVKQFSCRSVGIEVCRVVLFWRLQ